MRATSPTSLTPAAAACALVLLCAPTRGFAVDLIADYQLHDTFASSVAGAPPLAPINSVSFTTASVYGHTSMVAAFLQGSGLRMDVPAGLSAGGYTVAMIFSFESTSGYRKIIDFKDRSIDAGLYDLSSLLDFYPVAAGSSSEIPPGAFLQVVLTRNAAGLVAGYVNGVPQFSFADTGALTLLSANSFYLFIDDFATSQSEASAGSVARIRVYNGALSASAVAALDGNPPPPCGSADFDCDGDTATDFDILAFFACIAGSCPGAPCMSSADFDGDGDTATDFDIQAFFRVLGGGSC